MRNLIIFDLDGTLAHTAPDLLATLNRIVEPHGISPKDTSHIGQIIGHGAKAMIARSFELDGSALDENLHEELFEEFLRDYSANLARETYLFEGVLSAIDTLAGDGFEFAVCTNKKFDMAVSLLKNLGVDQRFRSITGGDSFEFRKPDPRHLEETARLAGYGIKDSIMIGDSETDINAAINAGIPSIAVTFGYSDKPVETLGASSIIGHFREFEAEIRRLSGR